MTMYKQGERWRFEGGNIAIVVDDKGSMIQFDNAKKIATKLDLKEMQKNQPKPSEEVAGLLKKIRDLKGEGVERVGEETLDGKKTTVYALKDVELAGAKSDWRVWVDLRRKLPVRMEMTKGNAGAEVVMTSEFSGWNEDFDPNLFSTAVPEGYKLVNPPAEKQ
jgi:outer membrane lipoprotein-sorting protein